MDEKIKLGIIDDHAIVLEGLSKLLSSAGLKVEFATTDGEKGQTLAYQKDIDVLILDVRIPGFDTAKFVRALKDKRPDIKVICLSSFDSPYEIAELLSAGVSGYVIKNISLEQLLEAINKVAEGQIYIDAQLETLTSEKKLQDILERKLTEREMEIAKFILKGLSNKEIAQVLGISESTVKTHVKNIMEKLGTKNRAEIVFEVLKEGIIREDNNQI